MTIEKPTLIHRHQYTEPLFYVDSVDLIFQLQDKETVVFSTMRCRLNQRDKKGGRDILLNGEELQLKSIKLDGRVLTKEDYLIDNKGLTIFSVPTTFTLDIETIIFPSRNSSLQGLYQSNNIYCSQCEAEGFRKITYYPDRPDVLAKFTTRIEANKALYPVLLSNGNPVESGDMDNGVHYAVWHDPFPKPCYLFALVAGDLSCIEDIFRTKSGKKVDLHIFVEKQNKTKCEHAMSSLKKAMAWDEKRFGLEYDLDIYMIVAVDDFNMGAMENKGLNIFNSKYVLSSQESATDQDYLGIESVIAHEYFHNWTGNRVTCRDWFQLSLKEGLTVFRDQEFSADMQSRSVQRIDDVRVLKNFQFREDSGPTAHPIRPDAYFEINNFYTSTVYNKGAEVIRMIHTLLGEQKFRKGMDLYFKRHDGQAVTCDDFVAAMASASGIDLDRFTNWYSQAGTPRLEVEGKWLEEKSSYHLLVRQSCPDTPGQSDKKPFHMPLAVGLLNDRGEDFLGDGNGTTLILELKEREQLFIFDNISTQPVLSFLRDFSAPVKVNNFQSEEDLSFLIRHDSNLYNRWDAFTQLAATSILQVAQDLKERLSLSISKGLLQGVTHLLGGRMDDAAFYALMLNLPTETRLALDMDVIDPDALHRSRQIVKRELAGQNREQWLELYKKNGAAGDEYSLSHKAMGKRALRNLALNYLMALDPLPDEIISLCYDHYQYSTNMTDTIAALSNIINTENDDVKERCFSHFYKKWFNDPLVMDKWFSLQAMSHLENTLDRVRALMGDKLFNLENPNKVRALIGSFAAANHVCFHQKSGEGYEFLADIIITLDTINPQVASRLVMPLINWRRYDASRQLLMQKQLNRIGSRHGLSRDVFEIVSKSLESEDKPGLPGGD